MDFDQIIDIVSLVIVLLVALKVFKVTDLTREVEKVIPYSDLIFTALTSIKDGKIDEQEKELLREKWNNLKKKSDKKLSANRILKK